MSAQSWHKLYDVAAKQSVIAVLWDTISQQELENDDSLISSLDQTLKIRWAINVEQIERKYAKQRAVIARMARFFAKHGIHK